MCLIGGPRLSAQTRAPSLPRSLAAPWDRPIGAVALAHARFPSLCPIDPTCQRVPNLSPTISSSWTRPRQRVLRPRPSPRALLAHLPSSICALCPALSPSLSLALPTRTENLRNRQFRGRHCARAPSSATVSFTLPSATRDTLRCALPPLWSVRSALTGVVLTQSELRHRRPIASLCLRRCPVPPALPLKVSNLPAPLFPCVLH